MLEKIKGYVVGKRFLYTLCFIALMVIDWTRGSQVGSTWAWTINMTGVIMAVILFSAYSLREFLKPAYIIYSVIGSIALIVAYCWRMENQTTIFLGQILTAILNVWLLGIFIIKLFSDCIIYRINKIRFCKIEILTVIMLLWMLFSVNEDIWPGWYLIMFEIFYHTEYGRENIEALKQGMLDGIIAAFFLLQGAAFAFRPYDVVRYSGIYSNCNMNALFYGIVWIAFLIKLHDNQKKKEKSWKEVLCFLFAGALVAFNLLTICRTALVAMVATGFFYVIFADFHSLKYKAGKMFRRLILYILVVCISIPITFVSVRYLPTILHHPIWYEGEYNIYKVHSYEPWDSEHYVSWEKYSSTITSRFEPYIKKFFGKKQAGMGTVQATSFTIGNKTYSKDSEEYKEYGSILVRLALWEYYIKNGTLEGHHGFEGHEIQDFNYVWHTQNVFIQFWYYYGIPSAILLLIVIVILIAGSIKKMLEGQSNALICLLYLLFWSIYGLAEAVWYPGQAILFLVFFTPKFLQKIENGTEKVFI